MSDDNHQGDQNSEQPSEPTGAQEDDNLNLSPSTLQQIELAVRRKMQEIDAEREKTIIETLKSQRDFLVGNTRWVVGGFFGVLIIAAAAMTFVVGSRVDREVIRSFVEPNASAIVKAQVEAFVKKQVQSSEADIEEKIKKFANDERVDAEEKISRSVSLQIEQLLREGVKEKLDEVAQEFNKLTPDQLLAQILPSGAVVAFERSERAGGACPPDWSLFREAGGRVIVGAGQHNNQGLRTYPSYRDNPTGAVGGEETITLTSAQIPSHDHKIDVPDSWGDQARAVLHSPGSEAEGLTGGGHGRRYVNLASLRVHSDRDSGQELDSLENMPPYIALYYCKKD